jgi:raffinose/stachyose/melibiose transport system substrate-binding protein
MHSVKLFGWEKIARVVAAIALVAMGTAGAQRAAQAGSPVTVTVWSWRSQDAPMWNQVQKVLQKRGENIRIDFTSKIATEYDAALQTAMTGGKGPDIFYGRAGAGTVNYAAANLIAPLSGKVDFKDVSRSALDESAAYKGKYYGVPFAIQTVALFYNKAIFRKYHLSPPRTWEDFLRICATLKKNGVTPLYVMGTAQQWMLALSIDIIGASTVSDAWTRDLVDRKVGYTSPPYVETLTKFRDLVPYFEHNYTAVGTAGNEQEEALGLGRAAMIFDGIWAVPMILQYNKNLQLGEFLAPPSSEATISTLPKPTAYWTRKPQVFWYVDGDFALNSHISSKAEAAAALKVIQFTATPEFGRLFTDIAGEISPISGVTIPSKYPLSVEAYHQFQTERIDPPFDIRSPMDTPPPRPVTAKKTASSDMGIFSAVMSVVTPLITNKMSPEQAAAKIQKDLSWYFKK